MAKPSPLPRWNTDATNRTTPTSGQMDTGIEVGEAANSSRMNWLLNMIYLWLKWVDDGVWTAVSLALSGGLTVATTLAVTGAATLSSTLAVTSNATIGGTLGVTGALSCAALTYTGTDIYPARTDNYSWRSGSEIDGGGAMTRVTNGVHGDAGEIWQIPIVVREGTRITQISIRHMYDDGGTETITATLKRVGSDGALATVSGSTTTTNTSGELGAGPLAFNKTSSALTEDVTGDGYYISFEWSGTDSSLVLLGCSVTHVKLA